MDAARALADLTEISSQIEAAAVFDADGVLEAATLADEAAALSLVAAARELLAAADDVRPGGAGTALMQLEAATREGSVFVVRDGRRRIVAATAPAPTVGLVFYDLKSCLRSIDAPAGGEAR